MGQERTSLQNLAGWHRPLALAPGAMRKSFLCLRHPGRLWSPEQTRTSTSYGCWFEGSGNPFAFDSGIPTARCPPQRLPTQSSIDRPDGSLSFLMDLPKSKGHFARRPPSDWPSWPMPDAPFYTSPGNVPT